MEAISKAVKNNIFSSPFQQAKCEGLKVNETRTIAAASANGKNDYIRLHFTSELFWINFVVGLISWIIIPTTLCVENIFKDILIFSLG